MRGEATPQQHHRSSLFRQSHHGRSLSSSVLFSPPGGGGTAGTPRKKLSGFGDAEGAVREKRARRAEVLGKLKGSLEKKGVSVWAMDEAS